MRRPSLPAQPGLYRPQPGPLRIGATFVLILALLAGAGFGAQRTLLTLWDRVVGYDSPYRQQLPMPGAGGLEQLTPAVVMVVIDGLRIDATSGMPTLQALMASGTVAAARTELPSLSLPGAAALGTGASPTVHGVTTNWYEGPIGLDSIFAAVRRAGLPTTFIGWSGWEQLYGTDMTRAPVPDADKDAHGEHDRAVRELALGHLSARPLSGLTVVYFSETDDIAHTHGGASQEYLAYAAQVDSYLAAIVASLDLGQVTLLVTADHGHVDAGGHGGGEPEVVWVPAVAAGRGIRAVWSKADGAGPAGRVSPVPAPGREWPTISQLDIAPTIAALLEAPVPTHSEGKYVPQWFGAADTTWHATRMIATAAARSHLSTLLTGLGRGEGEPPALGEARDKLAAGDAPGALETAKSFMDSEAAERARLAASQQAARRAARLPWAVAAAVAPLLLLLVLARPVRPWAPVLAAGLYVLAFYLVYTRVHGLGFSFSAFNEEAQIKRFLLVRLLEGGGLMLAAALLSGLMSRDWDRGTRVTAGLGAVWGAALVVYALLLNVVWFYYQQGFVYTDTLPDMGASFRSLVFLLTAAGAGYAAVPSVLVTLGLAGAGLRRRHSPLAGRYR